MKLSDYQWSHNPRGLHNASTGTSSKVERWAQINAGWGKLAAIDREQQPAVAYLMSRGITPIIRIYRPRPGATPYNADMVRAWQTYLGQGVKWFEFYNEPNFEIEWPSGMSFSYADIPGTIAPLMQTWMDWAELIINMGGYPAFPALGEQIGGNGDVTSWLQVMLNYLAENYYERFRNIAANGMWVATHPYFYNHFYQEDGGVLRARPPETQNADQGGWHFEYPFDPLTQSFSPGLSPVVGPPDFPRGDPVSLVGMGYAFLKKYGEMFGGGAVPVVGTEGGITPVPMRPGDTYQADNRFPTVTWASHAEATLAAFNWIATDGPPWLFGCCLWIENDYFDGPSGEILTVERLAKTTPLYKTVPPIDAIDGPGPGWRKLLKGPGPIHGTPDMHFLILSPGFNTNWFFSEVRDYYGMFRPTVLSTTDFIAYIPPEKSLACTILCVPELVDYMTHHIKDRWPNVYFDLIVANDVRPVAEVLSQRVSTGRRFG
jgi:hypothetical protein